MKDGTFLFERNFNESSHEGGAKASPPCLLRFHCCRKLAWITNQYQLFWAQGCCDQKLGLDWLRCLIHNENIETSVHVSRRQGASARYAKRAEDELGLVE
jgi:hypothetical protein